jgi:hypothetical protein
MTGGPNSSKHPIDYEFSEYNREELMYHFATATQEEIDRIMDEKTPEKPVEKEETV